MADITMCPGDECPLRMGCYRYTAMTSAWQSWFATLPGYRLTSTIPSEDGKWECEYYWPVKQPVPRGETGA